MPRTEIATFAGGCFWGMQDLFRKHPGVLGTRVGYTGGDTPDPSYDEVKTGTTNHAEAIEIEFDADEVSYRELVEFFFSLHDPTTVDRQGHDVGSQYRSAIFFHSGEQEATARDVVRAIEASGKWPGPVVTQIVPAQRFYLAEELHQDYLITYPDGYTCHFVRPEWRLDREDAD
ncbi:MAG: peptide-methionine (S)-S-oxide reductase MsrA [Parvularculaceae bacterium]